MAMSIKSILAALAGFVAQIWHTFLARKDKNWINGFDLYRLENGGEHWIFSGAPSLPELPQKPVQFSRSGWHLLPHSSVSPSAKRLGVIQQHAEDDFDLTAIAELLKSYGATK